MKYRSIVEMLIALETVLRGVGFGKEGDSV